MKMCLVYTESFIAETKNGEIKCSKSKGSALEVKSYIMIFTRSRFMVMAVLAILVLARARAAVNGSGFYTYGEVLQIDCTSQ
ncbi:hypothetical protein C0J52_12510 [Blattella germanica]|nr:hypothetical protein C0J52_12510 [Blattella germanica]